MNSLPLSWSVIKSKKSDHIIIDKWNLRWHAINFSPCSDYKIYFDQFEDPNSDIIIRGCNSELEKVMSGYGFSSIQFGMEAVLKTSDDHFNKKSLKKLIKRGNRHGIIEKIKFSVENKTKLNDFKKFTSHSNEPQLKNLFQTEFSEENNLYVFKKFTDDWLGAILISQNSNEKLHAELILRHSNAPVGIMEALVHYVFEEAKSNGWNELSLGEVPFKIEHRSFDLISNAIKSAGKLINFAYNHNGLYNFKNKFQPRWENLYICSSSKLRIKHILFILFYSNFHKLLAHKLFYIIKKYIVWFFDKNFRIFIPKQLDFNKT